MNTHHTSFIVQSIQDAVEQWVSSSLYSGISSGWFRLLCLSATVLSRITPGCLAVGWS
jgi:hypothetical protein